MEILTIKFKLKINNKILNYPEIKVKQNFGTFRFKSNKN
jgi:hypothetical protein